MSGFEDFQNIFGSASTGTYEWQQADSIPQGKSEYGLCERACDFMKRTNVRLKWEITVARLPEPSVRLVMCRPDGQQMAGPWAETKRGALVALARAVLP